MSNLRGNRCQLVYEGMLTDAKFVWHPENADRMTSDEEGKSTDECDESEIADESYSKKLNRISTECEFSVSVNLASTNFVTFQLMLSAHIKCRTVLCT